MKEFLKRYRLFIFSLLIFLIIYLVNHSVGAKAIATASFSLKEMFLVIPPIFILLGLLDVWISKQVMTAYMGEGSGFKGVLLAILIGAIAAGPLYASFPVAAVLMSKGVKFSNVLIFVGAWSTTKIPMLIFEMSALGVKFTLVRLVLGICSIIVIAYLIDFLVGTAEKVEIYQNVAS